MSPSAGRSQTPEANGAQERGDWGPREGAGWEPGAVGSQGELGAGTSGLRKARARAQEPAGAEETLAWPSASLLGAAEPPVGGGGAAGSCWGEPDRGVPSPGLAAGA